jgi:hypothetical protein
VSTHIDNNNLDFEATVAILAQVPKAEVDALEADRPKRKKQPKSPQRKRRKKPA